MTKEFDKRNAAKSRRVCEAMAEAASTGKRVLTERERQILDMWPRFEDGEPVMFGDRFIDHRVNERTVRSVIVNNDGVELRTFDGTFDWHEAGERVKRHVQSVLDADGVEIKVGDTVYGIGRTKHRFEVIDPHHIDPEVGEAFSVRCYDRDELEECHCKPKLLTHTRPDSWKQIVEDMKKSPCAYFGFLYKDCDEGDWCPADESVDCRKVMTIDIVRRAKALAGVEVDE